MKVYHLETIVTVRVCVAPEEGRDAVEEGITLKSPTLGAETWQKAAEAIEDWIAKLEQGKGPKAP